MKLISWDIGIKNLAYCVIDYDYIKNTSETVTCYESIKNIIEWDIINVVPDCDHCYKTNCKKPASFKCYYYGKSVKWCLKHDSIYNKLFELDRTCNSNNLSKKMSIKTINCININIDVLRMSLIQKLDRIILPLIKKYSINYSLIENQPAMRNPRMKAIADTVYTWFLIRGIVDSKIIKSIHFISPSNKLKEYADELTKSDNKYKSTKMKSISVVNDYFNTIKLSNTSSNTSSMIKWIKHLEKFNKKDDLCDTLLQGYYWIDKNKPIDNLKKSKK